MTSNPFYTDATAQGMIDNLAARANGGFVMVYSGPQPGSANQALTGTLLAKLPLSATAFGASAPSGTDGINPPAQPAPTTVATGGTVLAGTYTVCVTYVTAIGETTSSLTNTVTTTGSTSTLTIPSPAASSGATGWYAYVSQAGGATMTRQQAPGSPTAIGTGLTLTAPPTSSGVQPPGVNTSGNRQVVATANPITSEAATATGTAGYHALVKSDGVTVVAMGSVGTTGCDLNLNSTGLTSGNLVSVSSYTLSQTE